MINLADPSLTDTLLRFAGRLHPVMVHFPIALFVVAAMLEVFRLVRRKPEASPTAITCVIIGAIGAAAAAFTGWMNADYETQSQSLADTLFWHRWLGISVAVVGVILASLAITAKYVKTPALHRFYALLLIGAAVMVGLTAHQGGSMVYGPNYMFEVFNKPTAQTSGENNGGNNAPPPNLPSRPPPAGATLTIDFNRDIHPIFIQHCVECHGPSKVKGGLRLDHPGHLFTSEEDIWAVIPEAPEDSELVKRIVLHKGQEGRMPPEGDPLPASQVDLIKTWIAEGAYWSIVTTPAPAPTPATPAPATAPTPAPSAPPPSWTGDETQAIDALRAIGARVEPIAADSTDLDINLSLAGAKVTDDHLAAVARLGARVKSLNLARTPVTDRGVLLLSSCTTLRRLHLEETAITDQSLDAISKLASLEYLNLMSTKVTDAGIAKLAACKSLKDLYTADTGVTLDAVLKLHESNPKLNVEMGIPK